MAAAAKEISMDAEAATVLSKPGGGLYIEKKGKQSVLAEVIFSVEKHFQQVVTRFSQSSAVQRISSRPHTQI